MRAFVGLPLPDHVLEALEALQDRLDVGRRVAGENLHLTLAFLDDQPTETLAALHEELSAIDVPGPALKITGLEVFGGRKPRILFAGVEAEPALARLRERVRAAARIVGIELRRERFRPHITLARFPAQMKQGEIEKLQVFLASEAAFALPVFSAAGFALYRSELHPEGPVYEILADYSLDEA